MLYVFCVKNTKIFSKNEVNLIKTPLILIFGILMKF